MSIGYRSIEIQIINQTNGHLVVVSSILGSDSNWIGNEEPRIEDAIAPGSTRTYGAYANANYPVEFTVTFSGAGHISYRATIDKDNTPNCQPSAPGGVNASPGVLAHVGGIGHVIYNDARIS